MREKYSNSELVEFYMNTVPVGHIDAQGRYFLPRKSRIERLKIVWFHLKKFVKGE